MEVTRQDGEYCWNVIPEYADAEKIPWFDAVNHTSFVLHGAGYSIRYEARDANRLKVAFRIVPE